MTDPRDVPPWYLPDQVITALRATEATQAAMAATARVSTTTMWKWLNGAAIPPGDDNRRAVVALCRFAGVKPQLTRRRPVSTWGPRDVVAPAGSDNAAGLEYDETPEEIEARYQRARAEILGRRRTEAA
jgi:hypothetical protein